MKLSLLHHILHKTYKVKDDVISNWNEDGWTKNCQDYLNYLNLQRDDVEEMEWKVIKDRINEIERKKRQEWIQNSDSVELYKGYKERKTKKDDWDISESHNIRTKLLSGSLNVKWRFENKECCGRICS